MTRFEGLTLAAAQEVCRAMRPNDAAVLRAMLGSFDAETFALDRFESHGAAWMLVDEIGPIAIGGLELRNAWAGCMWFLAHARADQLPPTDQTWRKLVRCTRTVISNALNPSNPHARHRVETYVLSTWPQAQRLVRHLGFAHEGTCRAAGSAGEDIEIWAQVRPSTTRSEK